MPETSTSTVSPGCMGPTPAGVPVEITSPGSRVMEAVMKEMSARTPVMSCSVPVSYTHLEKGVGQRPVVGEEEQPLGVQIQPPNRPHPGAAAGHQLRHGAPPLFIREGGYVAPVSYTHLISVGVMPVTTPVTFSPVFKVLIDFSSISAKDSSISMFSSLILS